MTDEAFAMLVIYNSPKDFPGKFVLRKWLITGAPEPVPTNEIAISDTLEEVREFVPPGLIRLERAKLDDPVIVETWF